jgi:predicted GIY-YIG superfamily endonuclease
MEQVYVLELAGGRYYIGKTTDVVKRVKEHASGKGAGYTKLYKPKKLIEVRPMKSEQDENNLTREYMSKYGVDNVRGGAYSQIALPPATRTLLTQEFRGASDACFTCGKHGHFASACLKKQKEEEEEDVCGRCGRNSHDTEDCYANTHFKGYTLDSDDEDESCDESEDSYEDSEDSEDSIGL